MLGVNLGVSAGAAPTVGEQGLVGQGQPARRGSVTAALVVALLSVVVSSCGDNEENGQGDVSGKTLLVAHHGKSKASSAVRLVRLPAFRGSGAAWSPNGRWIAIPGRRGITLRNVKTGTRKHLDAPPPRSESEAARLNWSPDGRTLRYVTQEGPKRRRGYWVTTIRRNGSSLRQVPLGIFAPEATWATGGWPLVFVTRPYAYDIERGNLGPEPALWSLTRMNGKPKSIYDVGREIREPAFSPDGSNILFVESSRRSVRVMTVGAGGSSSHRLVGGLREALATWSPGGKKVALAATTWKGDLRQHLYTAGARGGKLHRLSAVEVQGAPAWSPSGRWIAYANYDANYDAEIRAVHPNGRGETIVAKLPGKEVSALQWSPDNRYLAYMAWPRSRSD
jgi:Tol biopolymer transport system component